ncbi:hypothetical protein [Lysinibacillus capsici]|uniref:hypothetical protein n=1 Tax=Lysinibacillus capsici TaxID=2115968 RepID=UPI002798769B|nr:hypothetical protein QIX46_02065 [Lysinibacillus boronitolerans]
MKKLKEVSNTAIKNGIVDENKIIMIHNSNNLKEDFYTYATNFRQSAWLVANEMVEGNDISKLDTMFFPLTFLYRHSLELILKAIAFKYIENSDERMLFLEKTFHNLSSILEIIEPFIKELIMANKDGYQWVKQFLSSMSVVDKESDSFRYPFRICKDEITKSLRVERVFEKQNHINLINLVNKMEITFGILESYYVGDKTEINEYESFNPIFLEEGGTYYGQSVVGFRYNRADFYLYTCAYERTANHLYTKLNTESNKVESLFFPLCYLYRNALELSLKDIVFELYPSGKALELIVDKKHSVWKLWDCIEKGVKEHSSSLENDGIILNYRNLIRELHDYDATADKFRYPIDKRLKPYFELKKRYNVESFNSFFNEILGFLSGVSSMISHHNEMLAEYEREMRN